MILPLMNAVTLKTATSTTKRAPRTGSATEPGGKRARLSATRTGLMMVGLLVVGAAMLKIAKRRSR
jgi:hypothetical protein